MRYAIALLVAAVFALPAVAQVPQKTGYQIKGCTYYQLVNGRVRRICDLRNPRDNPDFWEEFKRQSAGGGTE